MEPQELGFELLAFLSQDRDARNLDSTLRDVIGPGTPYPPASLGDIREAIWEAWAWLEGQALLIPAPNYRQPTRMRILSRRAKKLTKDPELLRRFGGGRLSKESLHSKTREDVWSLFHRGKFDTAVFEAMKAVEVAVRDAAGLAATDLGVTLMRKAFDKNSGALTDFSMEDGEREARAHLFAGAIGSYKNPHSHRHVALVDPDETAEIIMLANHLLRIVDSRGP
jgi:uncharacterized protein (TIGR02391 family)